MRYSILICYAAVMAFGSAAWAKPCFVAGPTTAPWDDAKKQLKALDELGFSEEKVTQDFYRLLKKGETASKEPVKFWIRSTQSETDSVLPGAVYTFHVLMEGPITTERYNAIAQFERYFAVYDPVSGKPGIFFDSGWKMMDGGVIAPELSLGQPVKLKGHSLALMYEDFLCDSSESKEAHFYELNGKAITDVGNVELLYKSEGSCADEGSGKVFPIKGRRESTLDLAKCKNKDCADLIWEMRTFDSKTMEKVSKVHKASFGVTEKDNHLKVSAIYK